MTDEGTAFIDWDEGDTLLTLKPPEANICELTNIKINSIKTVFIFYLLLYGLMNQIFTE
jgi:hypothetical protein